MSDGMGAGTYCAHTLAYAAQARSNRNNFFMVSDYLVKFSEIFCKYRKIISNPPNFSCSILLGCRKKFRGQVCNFVVLLDNQAVTKGAK